MQTDGWNLFILKRLGNYTIEGGMYGERYNFKLSSALEYLYEMTY